MASTIARQVVESVVFPPAANEPLLSESEENDLSELRELQFQGLWARVELEALFAAGLVSH
jgi:hypothetical protein